MESSVKDALGIVAISTLQKMAGIHEPIEKSRKGWDGMSMSERQSTLTAFKVFCPEEYALYIKEHPEAKEASDNAS